MDTKKALTAIIILLVIMNITLGVYLVVINSGKGDIEDTLSYTTTILKNRNYIVESYIPEKAISLSSFTFEGNRFNEQSIGSVMEQTGGTAYIEEESGIMYFINTNGSTPVPRDTSRTSIEAAAADFIYSIGINRDEFTLDYYRETGDNTFSLKYIAIGKDNNLYFDSYVEINITDNGVQSASIMYPEIIEEQKNQGEGIPVYTILLASLQNSSQEKVIESINSGYYSINSGMGTANISWRVRFSDGQERFFDAATGEEIR